jgi:ferredoxin-nitrite reductase
MQTNKIERLKAQCRPFDFRERIAALDLNDLSEEARFYLKNYGIYNIKLRPESFMLRIRIKGGRISLERLAFIHALARKYRLEILLTARAQMELHGLSADSVLEVWQVLLDAGITTLQTLTDNFRNIVTDPYDGENRHSRIEVYGLIEAMESLFLDDPEWMGMLPRKFNTAISGTTAQFTHFFGNDLFFAPAHKEGAWGFNLYLGGKNSETAKPADLFVRPDEVPAMFEAVAKAYREIGLRGSRARTRLYHLLEAVGMAEFLQEVYRFYPGTPECAGELALQKAPFHDFTPLRGGKFGYCFRSIFGKVDLARLESLIAFARKEDLEIRLGIDQNFHLLGLKAPEVPWTPVKGAAHVTACAGSSYCALSLWDIKSETDYLPLTRIQTHQIQVGFSGCLKGCGRHHHCDIGLVGLRTNLFGQTQKAARVFLGGQYSSGSASARLIFPSVPLSHLSGLIDTIIDAYEESGEKDFEDFTEYYLNPHSTFFVMLWFLAQCYLKQPPKLERADETQLYASLAACEDFPLFEDDENYLKSIKTMMHALWDDEVNEE